MSGVSVLSVMPKPCDGFFVGLGRWSRCVGGAVAFLVEVELVDGER